MISIPLNLFGVENSKPADGAGACTGNDMVAAVELLFRRAPVGLWIARIWNLDETDGTRAGKHLPEGEEEHCSSPFGGLHRADFLPSAQGAPDPKRPHTWKTFPCCV